MNFQSMPIDKLITRFLVRPYGICLGISLLLWFIFNAKQQGWGLESQLLYHPAQLFSDWVVTAYQSAEKNPWAYIGTKFENKLPPTFYGPLTYLIVRLSGIRYEEIIPYTQSVAVYLSLLCIFIFFMWKIHRRVNSKHSEIIFWFTILSYPVVFMVNRGSAIIVTAALTSILCFCLLTSRNKLAAVFITMLIISHWQNIILFCLFADRSLRKFVYLPIATLATSFLVMYSVGATPSLLASTLSANKDAMKDTLHNTSDLVSQAKMLIRVLSYTDTIQLRQVICILSFFVFLLSVVAFVVSRLQTPCSPGSFGDDETVNTPTDLCLEPFPASISKDGPWYTTSKNLQNFLVLSSISILISNPSYDYHLCRLLPIAYVVVLLIDKFFDEGWYSLFCNKLKLGITAEIYLLSFVGMVGYHQIWGPYNTSFSSVLRTSSVLTSMIFGYIVLEFIRRYSQRDLRPVSRK